VIASAIKAPQMIAFRMAPPFRNTASAAEGPAGDWPTHFASSWEDFLWKAG
jgi:hypothetical protein